MCNPHTVNGGYYKYTGFKSKRDLDWERQKMNV